MQFRSVTIDLDGTLLDTIVDLADACNAMLAELGQPLRDLEQIHGFVGKGMAVLVERCLTYGVPPEEQLLDDGVKAFRRHYARINGRSARLYPGVIEGLDALCKQGLLLACVTNKPSAFTAPLLEHTGLAGYFPVVVSGDTLPHKKPRPEPILHACMLMRSAPASNLHIGDSVNDIEAARAAGSPVLCVPYGYNEGRAVDSADCDALVSSLLEAAEWIKTVSASAT
ncbi:MAG: phosphoglycolate phosphatase [Rhodocyclaceae bacterium]